VPPCINKYYLLDLGAGNSLVEYAVAQGHQVFLISWRSAVPDTGHLTWDDYLEMGPIKATDVVLAITGAERTHALGFCVGGTILSCAAAVMAARGQHNLATVTLLTTMLDFSDTGDIGLLIGASSVALREATIGKGGILPGKELLNDDLEADPQGWFDAAEEKPGSWWPDWDAWIKRHSDGTIPAPELQGNAQYTPVEPAPGRYVKLKSN
jgi:poly(3-hydroxyalkanoate) synthetase